MKLSDMHPTVTGWKHNKTYVVSTWSFKDDHDIDGNERRIVTHHRTDMGEFINSPVWGWIFEPWSVGHGSVSDQQGMNQILRGEWTYLRNNKHPRYVAYDDVTIFDGFDVFS